MKKIKVRHVILIIYSIFVIFSLFYTVFPWFFSVDARNLRENIAIISEDMAKINGVEPIDTSNPIKLPYPYAATVLCDLSESWNSGYLTGVMINEQKNNYYDLSSRANPYDTYQKLTLVANDSNLQVVYDMISAQAASVNPNNELSEEILIEWNNQYSELKENTKYALGFMQQAMNGGCIYQLLITLPLWFYFGGWLLWVGLKTIKSSNKEKDLL